MAEPKVETHCHAVDLEKLNLEAIMREAAREPSAHELSMVPEQDRALFKEMRRNNLLLEWLVNRMVMVNNIVADHDKQLTPLKVVGKIVLAILSVLGGIAIVFAWIKKMMTP